jgi:D-sedoheptulose 7-phosphate isomerase
MDDSSTTKYINSLSIQLNQFEWKIIDVLSERIWELWQNKKRLFICGNGGSAANAQHLSNDLIFGVAPEQAAVRVNCLSSNISVLTCLANDTGYQKVFSLQLRTQGDLGDGLIVLSGSGNSPNIIEAVYEAKKIGMWTSAIVGFSGGLVKDLVDISIHFPVDDMQLSEDLQVVAGHCIMRQLRYRANRA